MYAQKDLISVNGHLITSDNKYYLRSDGEYDYWNVIGKRTGDILTGLYALGDISYDYCFRSNMADCLTNLNRLTQQRSTGKCYS